ncbi:hypothetical protein L227DRAFT_574218 [Lentinus tigrinus ALCF2SS1-6]|uniref:Uncharacterized protein n=1 Tax=Lentinus tigrinus ALCF2SS1-6 TaxID=1328759 RepID=A0A5C2SD69_9APHY|nr:hypothetical protein L227DRAFT_574218 [Lentinus tigrinus ALCF2SS1-6]
MSGLEEKRNHTLDPPFALPASLKGKRRFAGMITSTPDALQTPPPSGSFVDQRHLKMWATASFELFIRPRRTIPRLDLLARTCPPTPHIPLPAAT